MYKLELCTGREAKGISSKKLARFEYNRVQRVKDNIVGAGVIGGTVHSRYYPVSFHWSRTANYIVELASIRIYSLQDVPPPPHAQIKGCVPVRISLRGGKKAFDRQMCNAFDRGGYAID